ncbi:hypothetical protein JNUCC1_01861 [Lentibacillus sp. JNUCC-1]|nr:hypothetical protein [Lentibacillus sp. JNUCC-1]
MKFMVFFLVAIKPLIHGSLRPIHFIQKETPITLMDVTSYSVTFIYCAFAERAGRLL